MEKTYLGDGVYAILENGMIKLSTTRDYERDDIIYLELNVYENLVKFVEKLKG